MSGGYFPTSQKIASITPILKKTSLEPLDLGLYRPISNLTFLSKLLERAAYERIVSPFTPATATKHRSTKTATIKVMFDIYTGQLTQVLSRSLAFLISAPLSTLSTTRFALKRIESYTTGRSQFVRFNGETSMTTLVTSGVPQGSVHDLIFIAYSAEVISIVEHHGFSVQAFADDLQVNVHAAQHNAALLATRISTCIESVKAIDEFQPTSSQLFEDGTDIMVGI